MQSLPCGDDLFRPDFSLFRIMQRTKCQKRTSQLIARLQAADLIRTWQLGRENGSFDQSSKVVVPRAQTANANRRVFLKEPRRTVRMNMVKDQNSNVPGDQLDRSCRCTKTITML